MDGINCFIFDLDGTLADDSYRMPLLAAGDWNAYYDACKHDPIIPHVCSLANALWAYGYKLFIVSGRSESVRTETKNWLKLFVYARFERVYLRPLGDFRANSVVKLEALTDIRARGFRPIMAFDDEPAACTMWRTAGVPCAQVRGNEEFVEYELQAQKRAG